MYQKAGSLHFAWKTIQGRNHFFPIYLPSSWPICFQTPWVHQEKQHRKKEKRKKKEEVREKEHVIDVKICTEKHTNYTQGFRAVFFCWLVLKTNKLLITSRVIKVCYICRFWTTDVVKHIVGKYGQRCLDWSICIFSLNNIQLNRIWQLPY